MHNGLRMWPPVLTCPRALWEETPLPSLYSFNILRPRINGRNFEDDIFKWIFLNENVRISLKILLKFIHNVRIKNIPALVQIMTWRRPGDKPLLEPMVASLLTHICVTRPKWVKDDKQQGLFPLYMYINIYIYKLNQHTVYVMDNLLPPHTTGIWLRTHAQTSTAV